MLPYIAYMDPMGYGFPDGFSWVLWRTVHVFVTALEPLWVSPARADRWQLAAD